MQLSQEAYNVGDRSLSPPITTSSNRSIIPQNFLDIGGDLDNLECQPVPTPGSQSSDNNSQPARRMPAPLSDSEAIVYQNDSYILVRIHENDTYHYRNKSCFKKCDNHECTLCSKVRPVDSHILHCPVSGTCLVLRRRRGAPWLTCSSSNAIYAITCRSCNRNYVGQTSRTIKTRYGEHRSKLLNQLYKGKFLYEHVKQCGNHTHDLKILCADVSDSLIKLEATVIHNSGSLFPYGLNDCLHNTSYVSKKVMSFAGPKNNNNSITPADDEPPHPNDTPDNPPNNANVDPQPPANDAFNQFVDNHRTFFSRFINPCTPTNNSHHDSTADSTQDIKANRAEFLVYKLMQDNSVKMKTKVRGRYHQKPPAHNSPDTLLDTIKQACSHPSTNQSTLRHIIYKAPNNLLRQIANKIAYLDLNYLDSLVATDLIECKISKLGKKKISRNLYHITLPYNEHFSDKIATCIKDTLKSTKYKGHNVGVRFKYKDTVENLIRKNSNLHHQKLTCRCGDKCILTGDLDIIHSIAPKTNFRARSNLINILNKGLGYRFPLSTDESPTPTDSLNNIYSAIRGFPSYNKIKSDDTQDALLFSLDIIDKAKSSLESIFQDPKNKLRRRNLTRELTLLKNIQKSYCIISADKAAKTPLIVCKKYVTDLFNKELNSPDKYKTLDESENDLRKRISLELKNILGKDLEKISDAVENATIPGFNITIKLHKKGQRFLTPASFHTILGPVNEIINNGLSLTLNTLKKYSRIGQEVYGRPKTCFIVNSSTEALSEINQYMKSRPTNAGVPSFGSYDFTDLYGRLAHTKLIKSVSWALDKAMHGRKFVQVNISTFKVSFSNDDNGKSGNIRSLTPPEFLGLVKLSLDNALFRYNKIVYKQTSGCPMGVSYGPSIANTALYKDEYIFFSEKKSDDVDRGLLLRFLDDIFYIDKNLGPHLDQIYDHMSITKDDPIGGELGFLDLNISMDRIDDAWCVRSSTYDKRTLWKAMNISRCPHGYSLISRKVLKGVLIGRLVSFSRTNTRPLDFIKNSHKLILDMLDYKNHPIIIRSAVKKFISRHYPKNRKNWPSHVNMKHILTQMTYA